MNPRPKPPKEVHRMVIAADIPTYRPGPEAEENARDMTVEIIRERVARKEYVVDAEKVAGAIIDRLLAALAADPARDRS